MCSVESLQAQLVRLLAQLGAKLGQRDMQQAVKLCTQHGCIVCLSDETTVLAALHQY